MPFGRKATFAYPGPKIVQERAHPARRYVGIALQVPAAVEELTSAPCVQGEAQESPAWKAKNEPAQGSPKPRSDAGEPRKALPDHDHDLRGEHADDIPVESMGFSYLAARKVQRETVRSSCGMGLGERRLLREVGAVSTKTGATGGGLADVAIAGTGSE